MSTFTFTHASKPTYFVSPGSKGGLGFRSDMNRRAQLLTVARDLQDKKAHSDWEEYMKTWDTQHSHERALRCLLNEAHRYQATHCAKTELATLSDWQHFVDRLKRLANQVTELMGNGDEDKYVECLNEICSYHLFATEALNPVVGESRRQIPEAL